MLPKRYSVLLAWLLLMYAGTLSSQCTIVSTNGWTATITITPTAAVPEFTNCQWYYHYEVRYSYTVTFSGSTSGRSLSMNAYFTCSGGTGGNPYNSMGTFTGNASGTMTTTNNARQYTAVSSYNYGSNPSCTTVTVSDINCTSVRLDYWGSGVSNGTIYCALSASPLPIELLNFGAKADGKKVDLNWSTATEHNNDYFTVEKSRDGITFTEAFRVKGAGNSTGKLSYDGSDENPYTGISYYRLKQTDYDGNTTTFDIVPVDMGISEAITNAYPNPANGNTINIYVASESVSPVDVMIYNPLGQLLSKQVLYPDGKGMADQPVELPPDGSLFFFSISQDNKVIGHHKVCVTKN